VPSLRIRAGGQGAVATGDGEAIMRACLSFLAVEGMRRGLSPERACHARPQPPPRACAGAALPGHFSLRAFGSSAADARRGRDQEAIVRLREVTAASEEEQMHSKLTGAPAPPLLFSLPPPPTVASPRSPICAETDRCATAPG
jgi:hypothetical protein